MSPPPETGPVSVLFCTPTYAGKGYCVEDWAFGLVSALDGLRMRGIQAASLIIDNTDEDEAFWKRLASVFHNLEDISVARWAFPPKTPARAKLADCYNFGRQLVLDQKWDYLLTCEADVICSETDASSLVDAARSLPDGLSAPTAIGAYVHYTGERGTMVTSRLEADPIKQQQSLVSLPVLSAGKCGLLDAVPVRAGPELCQVPREWMTASDISRAPAGTLLRVASTPLGLTLISRSVLEKVCFRYEPRFSDFPDIWFALDFARAFPESPIWLAPHVEPEHRWRSDEWRNLAHP